jgi:hypothetical protein
VRFAEVVMHDLHLLANATEAGAPPVSAAKVGGALRASRQGLLPDASTMRITRVAQQVLSLHSTR